MAVMPTAKGMKVVALSYPFLARGQHLFYVRKELFNGYSEVLEADVKQDTCFNSILWLLISYHSETCAVTVLQELIH
jgi:hypothetical protein